MILVRWFGWVEPTSASAGIRTTPDDHPCADSTTWSDLAARASAAPEIVLHFASPTAFSFGDRYAGKRVVLLPGTELVFDSLARTWNEYAPEDLRIDRQAISAFATDHVVGRQFGRLETHMLRSRRSLQVGFLGDVTFTVSGGDTDARRRLNMLSDFALYSGVGMKTTMGMGQCCRQ